MIQPLMLVSYDVATQRIVHTTHCFDSRNQELFLDDAQKGIFIWLIYNGYG